MKKVLQEFVQQIEETAKSVMGEIHTAMPGKIVSIDLSNGTASVKPIGKYAMQNGKKLEYPVLTEVPLVFPFSQSAGCGIIFPVSSGDSCLIVVSEVELDEWRSGAESDSTLMFDLTSAVAIPGLLLSCGALVSKACSQNAVVISGNLVVEGSITSSGNIKGEALYGHLAGS